METAIIISGIISIVVLYLFHENFYLRKRLQEREDMFETLRNHFYKVQNDYVSYMAENAPEVKKEDPTKIIDD